MRKFFFLIIAAAVAGGVWWLFATGRLDEREAKQIGRQIYYKGRGAVEDLKPDLTATGDPKVAARCRDNLRLIESAKRRVASGRGQEVGLVGESDVAAALGGSMPRCPGGGRYSPGALVELPSCSIGSQNPLEKSDDHLLVAF